MENGDSNAGASLRAPRMRPDRVVQLCYARGMKQSQLADAVGIGRTVFSAKMHGHRKWLLEEIIALAQALGTTVGYLVNEENEEPASEASQ